MLALQLLFSTLPPARPAYSYARYSATTTQPLPFAPKLLAYYIPTQKVASTQGRELYSSSAAVDSSALQAETAQLTSYQGQQGTPDDFAQLWDSVSDELEQAWQSIRTMFR